MTFAEEIEAAAGGDEITGIVLASKRGWAWHEDAQPVQSWSEVRSDLDYEYDHGYGGLDSHAIVAWTANRVIFVREYDGSSEVVWLPTQPTPLVPETIGG